MRSIMRLAKGPRVYPVTASLAGLLAACSPGADDDRGPLEVEPEAELGAAPRAGTEAPPRAPSSAAGRDSTVAAAAGDDPGRRARAELRATEGRSTSGVVDFRTADNGMLVIDVEVAELAPGQHGLHIHENGDCSAPDASSAGDHYAPEGRSHGAPSDFAHHLGDLGNIEANEEGIADTQKQSETITLTGEHGIVERAVIVHERRDDLRTQPSGDSGDPVACGVIELIEPGDLRVAIPSTRSEGQ